MTERPESDTEDLTEDTSDAADPADSDDLNDSHDSHDSDDEGPGTQPADFLFDSASTMRPMATQAVFRPNFDDADGTSMPSGGTEPQDHTTAVTRAVSPTRRLGGGLVEIPRVPEPSA